MWPTAWAWQHLHQLVGDLSCPHAVDQSLDVPEAVDGCKLQQHLSIPLQTHLLKVTVPRGKKGETEWEGYLNSRPLLQLASSTPFPTPLLSSFPLHLSQFKDFNFSLCPSHPSCNLPESLVCDLLYIQTKQFRSSIFEDVFQEALRSSALVSHQGWIPRLTQANMETKKNVTHWTESLNRTHRNTLTDTHIIIINYLFRAFNTIKYVLHIIK